MLPSDFIQPVFFNSTADFETEIISASGEMVLKTNNQNKIDISGLEKGMYFLKLKTGSNQYLQKFIKQ